MFKMNVVKADMGSFGSYILQGLAKTGKSTFWRDLVIEAWGNPSKGLMVSCGTENGYHHLDNLQVEEALEWNADYDEETDHRGLVQIIDDLIENNKNYGIKGVCFDTLDCLVDLASEETMRLSFMETKKKCTSLNSAFGGYGRGLDKVIELIKEQEARLHSIGVAVWYISHVKEKTRHDMITGDEYAVITNNLMDKVFSSVANNAQMIMMAATDRSIAEGRIQNEDRVLYLRGTSFIDAGSRFPGLPEKIEFTPAAFLDAFKLGVKNSSTMKAMSDEDVERKIAQERIEAEKKAEIARRKDAEKRAQNKIEEMESHRSEWIEAIRISQPNWSVELKTKIKSILNGHKMSDSDFSIESLKSIYDMIQ